MTVRMIVFAMIEVVHDVACESRSSRCVYLFIYIYIERERHMYIYIYIYICATASQVLCYA